MSVTFHASFSWCVLRRYFVHRLYALTLQHCKEFRAVQVSAISGPFASHAILRHGPSDSANTTYLQPLPLQRQQQEEMVVFFLVFFVDAVMSRTATDGLFVPCHKPGNVHLCATVAQPEGHSDLDRLLNCHHRGLVCCDENARGR